MVNVITLIGNLGQDPEIKATTGGTTVCNFSVATTHREKNGDQWTNATEWHRCTAFSKTAESMAVLKKGRQVYVRGSIRTRNWTDKDGVTKSNKEVVVDEVKFLGPKPSDQPSNSGVPDDDGPPF